MNPWMPSEAAILLAKKVTAKAKAQHQVREMERLAAEVSEEPEDPVDDGPCVTQRLLTLIQEIGPITATDLGKHVDREPRKVLGLLKYHTANGRVRKIRQGNRVLLTLGEQMPPDAAAVVDALRPMVKRYLVDGYRGTNMQWAELCKLMGA